MGASIGMLGCDRFFYYPDQRVRSTPDAYGLEYEDIYFHTSDGVLLHGWFLPAAPGSDVAPDGPRGTVLHVHGNAANITGHYEFIRWLPESGYNVLVFDYRGYGRSGGAVSRAGTILDAEAAVDYLHSRPDVDARRVFAIGQSLGGAVAIAAAARRPGLIRGLVVEGAFTRYRDIARHHVASHPLMLLTTWWYPLLLKGDHDPIDHVADVSPTPLLIMHGGTDRVVPARMGRELFDAAREPKELWIADGMDHYQVWDDHAEEARRRVLAFFERSLSAGR